MACVHAPPPPQAGLRAEASALRGEPDKLMQQAQAAADSRHSDATQQGVYTARAAALHSRLAGLQQQVGHYCCWALMQADILAYNCNCASQNTTLSIAYAAQLWLLPAQVTYTSHLPCRLQH